MTTHGKGRLAPVALGEALNVFYRELNIESRIVALIFLCRLRGYLASAGLAPYVTPFRVQDSRRSQQIQAIVQWI
jgi:hypothetical protein